MSLEGVLGYRDRREMVNGLTDAGRWYGLGAVITCDARLLRLATPKNLEIIRTHLPAARPFHINK